MTYLVYLDDSYEKPYTTIAAIAVPADQWWAAFRQIQDWRRDLKQSDGILIRREFRATEFVAGRGRLGPKIVTKHRRSQIFFSACNLLTKMPVRIFTSCRSSNPNWALDRLLTRVHRTMGHWKTTCILVSDAGKDAETTRIVRRLQAYNPIYTTNGTFNNPIINVIEDPFFKDSTQSYFVQMADFVAYALLRREQPLASKNRYGLQNAFETLKPVLVHEVSPKDPFGVIR